MPHEDDRYRAGDERADGRVMASTPAPHVRWPLTVLIDRAAEARASLIAAEAALDACHAAMSRAKLAAAKAEAELQSSVANMVSEVHATKYSGRC